MVRQLGIKIRLVLWRKIAKLLKYYCSIVRPSAKYVLNLLQTLESGIPCLEFNFHEGVWEAGAT